jgi:hypothetical protein
VPAGLKSVASCRGGALCAQELAMSAGLQRMVASFPNITSAGDGGTAAGGTDDVSLAWTNTGDEHRVTGGLRRAAGSDSEVSQRESGSAVSRGGEVCRTRTRFGHPARGQTCPSEGTALLDAAPWPLRSTGTPGERSRDRTAASTGVRVPCTAAPSARLDARLVPAAPADTSAGSHDVQQRRYRLGTSLLPSAYSAMWQ